MADEAKMKECFDTIDLDGKGTISCKELGAVLKALGEDESLAEVIIKDLDKDNDGVLTFDEFKKAFGNSKQ